MKLIKKFIICLIFISMLIPPITVLGQSVSETKVDKIQLSDNAGINIVETSNEQINTLIEFFEQICPGQILYLKKALNEAKIFDLSSGDLKGLNLATLENKLNSISAGRNKLKFFRVEFLWSELGNYNTLRTPYNNPYWNGPILGKFAIKWCFESSPANSRNIQIYDNYKMNNQEEPVPSGDIIFYAKKVWFHDFITNPRWDYKEEGMGSEATFIWAIGGDTEENYKEKTYDCFIDLLDQYHVLGKIFYHFIKYF